MKVGEKPSFDEYFHFLDGKYKCLWTLEPMKSYGTNRPSLLRLYAIKLGPNCYLIVYGGIKLGDTIQNSPVLKDKVFNKIDNVLNYLKANGNRISGAISTTTKDYIINYQDLQGIGMTLTENVTYDQRGWPMENSLMQYKIPTRVDVGKVRVEFENSYEPNGPFGAKSIGEVVINTPLPAISDAIYNAIGTRFYELPITPEKIAMAVAEKEGAV